MSTTVVFLQSVVLGLILFVSRSDAKIDLSVCDPSKIVKTGGINMPTLPKAYELGILVSDGQNTASNEILMGSDGLKAYAKITVGDHQITMVGDYKRDQMIEMDKITPTSDTMECMVSNLKDAADNGRWLFGYNQTVDPHPKDPAWALLFTQFGEIYTGTENVMGIPSNRWEACQEVKMRDGTMQTVGIKFAWSDPEAWTPVVGLGHDNKPISVPVFINMTQKTNDTVFVTQSYIFRYFNMGPPKEAFDIPQGVFCPGLLSEGTKIPQVPAYFSYDSEIIIKDGSKNLILYQKQYFDNQLNLTRLDFSTILDNQTLPDNGDTTNIAGETTLIHDYRAGLSYWLGMEKGTCFVTPVSKSQEDIQVERMVNPLAYLKDLNLKYTYYEEKMQRDIPSNLFMAIQQDVPGQPDTAYEFWFSANLDDIEGEGMWTTNKPVKFSTYPLAHPDQAMHINIFNFDVDRPNVLDYDISRCSPLEKQKEIQFSLGVPYNSLGKENLLDFKYQILIAAAEAMLIPPLRIHNMQIDSTADSTTVRFTVLAPAPVTVAGDHTADYKDTPSDEAIEKLRTSIDGGNIRVGVEGNPRDLKAIKGSLSVAAPVASPEKSSGHSDVAMAMLGLGMTVVGAIIGVVIIVLVMRKRPFVWPAAFEHKKFDNIPEGQTYPNP